MREEIKNENALLKYYTGIYKGLDEISSKNNELSPDIRAQNFINNPNSTITTLLGNTTKQLEKLGCLNVGICPECGETPILTNVDGAHYWQSTFGPKIFFCKSCIDNYNKETEQILKEMKQEKGGCYIATACYESPFAPEVRLLRNFRDNTLKSTYLGLLFIRIYYTLSPRIALFLKSNPKLNRIVREFLIQPILNQITKLEKYKF
jgi:hypothetical protein